MKLFSDKLNARLLVLLSFNAVVLYFTNAYLTIWGGEERTIRLQMIAAMIAVPPLVLVPVVLFRGKLWQRLAAIVFSILPASVSWVALQFVLSKFSQ